MAAAPGLPAAITAMLLLNLAFFGVDTFVPLALSELRGLSAAVAGLALTAATVTWTAGSWIQARLAQRTPRGVVTAVGLGLVALGIGGVTVSVEPPMPVWVAGMAWAVAGMGIGLAYSALSLAALERAVPGEEGRNSAAIQIASQLGTALGSGIGGVIVGSGAAGVSAGRIVAHCALMTAVAGLGALVARRV
jgi:predicted MFS family arabinose efflux permease